MTALADGALLPADSDAGKGPEPRSGAELIRATAPFQDECRWKSWTSLATTLAALGLALAGVVLEPWWPLKVISGVIAGLIQVRLFIFYHDAIHGAIFRHCPFARITMGLVGYYLVTPRKVWKESHDFHHQNNAKMIGSSIGSFPLMTREQTEEAHASRLFAYRATRHPLTMLGGYLTVFLFGMVLGPFLRNPKGNWNGLMAGALHVLLLILCISRFGWMIGICGVMLPSMVATATGSYLFYAQHNFPGMRLCHRADWSFTGAALDASSMFSMGRIMHWFTGNIGYHHVHHLNPMVPFYRLPETMRAIPELQRPRTTSWRIRDIIACCRLYAWDHAQGRMLSRAELRA